MRTPAPILVVLVLAVAAVGCAGPGGDTPDAVVERALAALAAGDAEALQALACQDQEDVLRDQLGLPAGLGEELLPGIDVQALVDAVRFDVGGVDVGEPAIEGDAAQVPVTGSLKVTFDAAAMRPILREVLTARGMEMTDEQLDGLLATLEAYGQDVPLEASVRLVREAGAWRICQDRL